MKYVTLYLNQKDPKILSFVTVGVQIYLGIFLLMNVPVGWIIPLEELGLPPAPYEFILSLWKTNYLMHTVKAIEFISAVLFLTNRYVFLGILLMLPALFNIVGLGLTLLPGGLSYSFPLVLGFAYLSFIYRGKWRSLLQ